MLLGALNRVVQYIKKGILKAKYKGLISFKDRISLGKNTEIVSQDSGRISFGKIVTASNVRLSCVGGDLNIGNCFINRNVMIVCRNKVHIGDGVEFGPNVVVYDHDHEFDKSGVVGKKFKLGEVYIGNNCWIGAGAIILRNTHIGDGTVIGAGTVVKGDIPPHSVIYNERKIISKALE